MKIAVATEDGINVCGHVGKCDKFIIFDIDGHKIVSKNVIDNIYTQHHNNKNCEDTQHGQGHGSHNALLTALKECNILISMGMGFRLREDLSRNNIIPVITEIDNAEYAVEKYLSGKLKDFPDKACQH